MAHKRRIYLINPSFQLKFSLMMSVLIFISSLMYPIAIYELLETIISNLALKNPQEANKIAEYKQTILFVITLWQIGFFIMTFIFCIFFSHKIAGPLYKLMKYLKKSQDGFRQNPLTFRSGDYFLEVADEVNVTLDSIHKFHSNDFEYLEKIQSQIQNLVHIVPAEKKPALDEIDQNIRKMRDKYGSSSKG